MTATLALIILFITLVAYKYIFKAEIIINEMPISGKENYGVNLESAEALRGSEQLRNIRQYKFYRNRSCTKVRKHK